MSRLIFNIHSEHWTFSQCLLPGGLNQWLSLLISHAADIKVNIIMKYFSSLQSCLHQPGVYFSFLQILELILVSLYSIFDYLHQGKFSIPVKISTTSFMNLYMNYFRKLKEKRTRKYQAHVLKVNICVKIL